MGKWIPSLSGSIVLGVSVYFRFLTNDGLWIYGIALGILLTIVLLPHPSRVTLSKTKKDGE